MDFKAFAQESIASYLEFWRKYTGFSGRTTRRALWQFVIVNTLVAAFIVLVEKIIGMDDGFFSSLYSVAIICPNVALNARRLHDVNKSGWWQLAIVVPFLNLYYLYLVWIKRGDAEANRFGEPAVPAAAEPVYGEYTVAAEEPKAADEPAPAAYVPPVANEFSAYEMCPAPKSEDEAKPNTCAACGTALKANAKFCSECGAPVN